jgi:phosphoglycolate phosphatase-like HAD superfamily hydrolase
MQARTGLAPEDILMVGDTPFDLDMARAAGVPSLAVGHGFYPQEALAACDPRAYAPDTAALRDILLAWVEG